MAAIELRYLSKGPAFRNSKKLTAEQIVEQIFVDIGHAYEALPKRPRLKKQPK